MFPVIVAIKECLVTHDNHALATMSQVPVSRPGTLRLVRRLRGEGVPDATIYLERDVVTGVYHVKKKISPRSTRKGAWANELEITRALQGHSNISALNFYQQARQGLGRTSGSLWFEYCDIGTSVLPLYPRVLIDSTGH